VKERAVFGLGGTKTMSDSKLRKALIRLAHEKPELRKDLLPLLGGEKKEARINILQDERAFQAAKKEAIQTLTALNRQLASLDDYLYRQNPDDSSKRDELTKAKWQTNLPLVISRL
jgi:hypothetical protein